MSLQRPKSAAFKPSFLIRDVAADVKPKLLIFDFYGLELKPRCIIEVNLLNEFPEQGKPERIPGRIGLPV